MRPSVSKALGLTQMSVPISLINISNSRVLLYLKGKSAHSDILEPLRKATVGLEGVESYSPKSPSYGYVVFSINRKIFAFVQGMRSVYFLLPESQSELAVQEGATQFSRLGKHWFEFTLFEELKCESNLQYWTERSYEYRKSS